MARIQMSFLCGEKDSFCPDNCQWEPECIIIQEAEARPGLATSQMKLFTKEIFELHVFQPSARGLRVISRVGSQFIVKEDEQEKCCVLRPVNKKHGQASTRSSSQIERAVKDR